MTEDEYIKERIDDQIAWYSRKGSINKQLNNWSKALIIALAAGITVLSQVDFSDQKEKNYCLALIGAFIAILTGVSGVMKFHEKWTKYRTTAETLKHERLLFKTRTGPYEGIQEPFKKLVPRVENLISRENSAWSEYVNKTS